MHHAKYTMKSTDLNVTFHKFSGGKAAGTSHQAHPINPTIKSLASARLWLSSLAVKRNIFTNSPRAEGHLFAGNDQGFN